MEKLTLSYWRNRPAVVHFVKDSLLLIVASGLIGFLFLLFHSVMKRMMGGEPYAILVSLLGLLNVLNVPSSAIQMAMARFVAEYTHQNVVQLWVTVARWAFDRILKFGLAALIVWFVAAIFLTPFLKAPTVASLWMVGLAAFVCLFVPVLSGVLQGSRRFGWLVASGLGAAATRLLFGVAIILLGGAVTAAVGAVIAGVCVGILLAYWPIRPVLKTVSSIADFSPAHIYRYFWPVMLGQGALFLLLNADLILFPRFLSGENLSAYGTSAMLARIILFLPAPIVVAMFPRAVTSSHVGLILGPVAFALAVSLAAATFVSWVPALPMRLMYSVDTPLHLHLVRLYVWAAIPLGLVQILANYLWARQREIQMLWLLPVSGLFVLGLFLFHRTPDQMIACIGVGGLCILALLVGVAWTLPKAADENSVF